MLSNLPCYRHILGTSYFKCDLSQSLPENMYGYTVEGTVVFELIFLGMSFIMNVHPLYILLDSFLYVLQIKSCFSNLITE